MTDECFDRWALRCSSIEQTTTFYDWEQHFAEEGYLVLANKVRRPEEADTIRTVIEKVFKRKIDPISFFDLSERDPGVEKKKQQPVVTAPEIEIIRDFRKSGRDRDGIVWTKNAVRLAVLMLHSIR